MIDTQSPAFIAACEAFNAAPICPELGAEIALAEGIAAYDKALWQPIETAPKDRHIDAVVDGVVRVVRWGKTSHVPLYGFCLADQGSEDFDLCKPTVWKERPTPPEEV